MLVDLLEKMANSPTETGTVAAEPADAAPKKREIRNPARCRTCGQPYAPAKQVARLQKQLVSLAEVLALCPACRRRQYARLLEQAWPAGQGPADARAGARIEHERVL